MFVEFDLSNMDFNKTTKVLSMNYAGGYPQRIVVKSHHTGKMIDFVVDVQAGIDNEFWDGEMCEYIPVEKCNVKKLVLLPKYF